MSETTTAWVVSPGEPLTVAQMRLEIGGETVLISSFDCGGERPAAPVAGAGLQTYTPGAAFLSKVAVFNRRRDGSSQFLVDACLAGTALPATLLILGLDLRTPRQ